MMPTSKLDPYQELEAYLQQAQAEVGKAVEDLLASESAGSASSSSESHNNSCPELYGCEADHKDNAPDAYASLSVPRAKRNTNGIVTRKTDSPEQDDLWHDTGPTTDQKTKDDCTWDAYYGWKSLQLSRPPSGDAHLLSIYTERLVEAVNDSFGLYPQEPSSRNVGDQPDFKVKPKLDFKVKPRSETVLVASSSENVPESTAAPPNSQKSGGLTSDSSPMTIHGALTFERDVKRAERADSEKSERSVRDVDADAANVKELIDRCSSWPNLRSLQETSVGVQLPNRSGSYPGLSKTVNPFCDTEDLVGSDQVLSYDGSLYKNQQLYYEPEDLPDCAGAPAVSVTEGVADKEKGQDFTDIELRIVDPDEAFDDLPELFIREDDRDNDSHAVPPIQDVSLSLNSPTLGRAQGRLNPYTIKVIANHASTPDEVFATVCTLEAKLASRLPPLEIDEGDPDTGTWSSTSTGHSTSTLSRHDLEKFLKNVEPPHEPPSWPQDAVTQTTPVISRSSSFTWVADLGEDVGSSKESLRIATQTTTTNTTTPNSPSPVSSLSSCEAPPTPLTPRTSPSSQEVSSDQSEAVNPIRSRSSKLQDSASPSMPTLANEDCGKSDNYRQLSLDEKTQVQSLSRSAIKGHGGNSSEVASAALSWAANQQLGQKASSAPVLLKNKPPTSFSGSFGKKRAQLFNTTASAGNTPEEEAKVFVQARSQSAKNIKEVEAVHACEWLRQAGFPQYVQMYEENCFPMDISMVLRDHPSLDPDELQSLFRRLNTLNKCARLKNDGLVKQTMHQDSDEEEGPALSYNWQFHRSSRRWSRVSPPLPVVVTPTNGAGCRAASAQGSAQEAYSSHDSVFLDEPRSSPESRLSTSDERIIGLGGDEGSPGHKLRRSGSERIRDAILRRMDSFRGNRRRKKRGPEGAETAEGFGGASAAPWSNHLGPENHALSDSECSPQLAHRRKAGSFKGKHRNQQPQSRWLSANSEHGRNSVYDNVPAADSANQGVCQQLGDNGSVGSGSLGRGQEESEKPVYSTERRDSGVGSSLTRAGNGSPCNQGSSWHCFSSSPEQLTCLSALRYEHLSASQLLVLKKLALLHLTALMERFSPPYRSGWGWAVPKFIRRMRAPDYKDKTVFGVPLSVSLQRTGHALPPSIQSAMDFLRKSAPEATGLFRKSGVRSRIQKLRSLHETPGATIAYEQQQAYDVADLLKQYFRELPDGLLTAKLSDTFLCIFQHIPEELRLDALQAAVLLIPDENREVLETLLVFLSDVCRHAQENQMTVANIAVCIAPSLFQLAVPRSTSASPRRRATTVGIPDQRELNENRAAHECLARMIVDHKKLFQIPLETLQQCRLEQLEPMTMDELGSLKTHLESCLHTLIMEAREKSKGWATVQHAEVELAFKKLGDGLPLRLWRCAVEVEAPPVELLTRILRERHVWDNTLLKWRHIAKLDKQSEVIQYICSSMKPQAPRDFCVLRAWRTELAKGSCALVELSVNHADATVLLRGVRAVVLASRYLIEPCGAGKSRVTHISRVDLRGRTPDWYHKVYGSMCALLLIRLRDSFAQRAEGPETKV